MTNKIASGDRYAAQGKWADAKSEYGAALALSPRSIAARVRLSVAANNLRNDWPGFEFDTHAARDASGLPKQVKVEGYPIEMVLVAGGDAEIGSERFASSKPIHTVVIESFYLARTEVTQALWRTVMGSNPSAHQGGKFPDADRLPVEQVSWRDAQTFIDKLNRAVPGSGFRLPTEVEWEFAARHAGGTPPEVPLSSPRAVGSSSPNQLGLYDMQGNVAEWCSSLAAPYPYDSGDGRERADAEGLRVLRGGAYNDTQDLLDPSLRHSERPDRRLKFNGFRLARSIRPPERSYACRTCEPASTARQ